MLAPLGAAAQVPSPKAPAAPKQAPAPAPAAKGGVMDRVPFFAAALTQLFSDTRSFTGGAELQFPAAPGEVPDALAFGVAMHQGSMRWELDLAQARVATYPKPTVGAIAEMGMDRIHFILQPEKPIIVAFPGLQGYFELALPQTAGVQEQALTKLGRLERKALGKETVDGQPTEKFQVTLRGASGAKEEATVWEATNLQNMPIKLQVRFADAAYGIQFRNVKLGQPDARYFQTPAGYKKYDTLGALMSVGLAKSLEKGGLPGFK